jgi:hypothetical protein
MSRRICACGCQRSLNDRRANAIYFNGACRVRAFRALQASTEPEPRTEPVVTLVSPPTVLSAPVEVAA